jgi:dTDP-glucose pyrophosphorylase
MHGDVAHINEKEIPRPMKDLTVSCDISIREAMKALNQTAEKCLLVINSRKKLVGTLTDGDLRRSILSGANFDTSIEQSFSRNPKVVKEGKYTNEEAGTIMLSQRVEVLPVVNEQGAVVGYITPEQVFSDAPFPNTKVLAAPVVIMAGGKGTRLQPFTSILPKPLVPIHEKPVIEHIIGRFTQAGVSEFYMAVNYKSRILRAYFEELQPEYTVTFIDEKVPLGTAGALKYLEGVFTEPFLVTNCDIMIDADYTDLYAFHKKSGWDLTIVASMKKYVIPYGTCELNGNGHLSCIKEKPEYNFLVNTGLYVLEPYVLASIPNECIYHITQLISDVQKQGMKIGVYPVSEDAWIDIGQWTEYRKAVERFG